MSMLFSPLYQNKEPLVRQKFPRYQIKMQNVECQTSSKYCSIWVPPYGSFHHICGIQYEDYFHPCHLICMEDTAMSSGIMLCRLYRDGIMSSVWSFVCRFCSVICLEVFYVSQRGFMSSFWRLSHICHQYSVSVMSTVYTYIFVCREIWVCHTELGHANSAYSAFSPNGI